MVKITDVNLLRVYKNNNIGISYEISSDLIKYNKVVRKLRLNTAYTSEDIIKAILKDYNKNSVRKVTKDDLNEQLIAKIEKVAKNH